MRPHMPGPCTGCSWAHKLSAATVPTQPCGAMAPTLPVKIFRRNRVPGATPHAGGLL